MAPVLLADLKLSQSADEWLFRRTRCAPAVFTTWFERSFRFFRPAQISGPDRLSRPILDSTATQTFLREPIAKSTPFLAGRFGAYELQACSFYWRKCSGFFPALLRCFGNQARWPSDLLDTLFYNAGVFPRDERMATRFAEIYLEAARAIDALAVWHRPDESVIHQYFLPAAQPIPLDDILPVTSPGDVWMSALKGRRVLVIHPFEQTIKRQFARRSFLFSNPQILPDFYLITLKAVQAIGGAASKDFTDWVAALDMMQNKIAALSFDVALIGAGAFGLPLGAFVKSLGKPTYHIGGALQILFGIKGRRWDSRPQGALYNEFWVRPDPSEAPHEAQMVEGACYW